ncbi:MAG TPA: AAA family ATPase [Ignavibacteriales bacterium]|nr:AAA family ATPase [Ignavibacteriales bacterium]HOL81933.1 AAA family ATPase [Ignavibacteriales bacterium]HOM65943.1 AAA family ATPase [Ignavibacteriales bacterium]HPD67475.1 AAA family ATPase [Ignavibacteriales bacterium]HPP34070.1 AAA family ATPase [Ignavibacteriales bacterium]
MTINSIDNLQNEALDNLHSLLKLPKDLIVTDEYKNILKLIIEKKQESDVIFITGSAGTGKSTLLEIIRRYLKIKGYNSVFLSPTGISALNINGQTIHSFFRIKPGLYIDDEQIFVNEYTKKIVDKLEFLVIDEISMVRADLLDLIDRILRFYKRVNIPFGGIKVIFIGDLMQLPPVVSSEESPLFLKKYESPYFFDADVFSSIDLVTIELRSIFRQSDEKFIKILQNIRVGEIIEDDVEYLNYHCYEQKKNINEWGIYLANYNVVVNNLNKKKLSLLPGPLYNLQGIIKEHFPTDALPVEKDLQLKEDALVMMQINSPGGDFVNGSVGRVRSIAPDKIIVEISGKNYEIERYKWEYITYDVDSNGKIVQNIRGTYSQFPIKLAWAITIHKSQGKTFDIVTIDFGKGSFAHGQTYVALSRCRSINDIKFSRPLKGKDFLVDEKILNFIHNKYKISFKLR